MGQVSNLAGRRWFRRTVVGLLAFDLLVAGATLGLHGRDQAQVFSADEAVAEFRATTATTTTTPEGEASATSVPDATAPVPVGPTQASVPAPGAAAPAPDPAAAPAPATATPASATEVPAPPFPADGVYVYDTTGFEEVDALGGARHDYPAQTSIVHRREGCGATETWQPFQDRRDVRQLCAEPGRHRLDHFDATRSFFGQTDTRRLECDDGATAFAAGAKPGDVFEFRCVQEGADAANRLEVLGVETVVVGGQAVEAIHSRATSTVSGGASGSSSIESWVHPETGLTLKRISVLDGSESGPGGTVSYHEEYTLVLRSLEPRR